MLFARELILSIYLSKEKRHKNNQQPSKLSPGGKGPRLRSKSGLDEVLVVKQGPALHGESVSRCGDVEFVSSPV